MGRPLTLHLLGRDVIEGAHELPRTREALLAGGLGQPEVSQECVVPTGDKDVLRLDVSVDQAGLVRRVERFSYRGENANRPPWVEFARDDHVLEVRPADQPHGDEHALIAVPRLVHGDDVRVVDPGLKLPLTPEPLAEHQVVAQVRRQHLERNLPVQSELGGLVDDPHAALTEDPGDPVSGERGALLERHPSPGGGGGGGSGSGDGVGSGVGGS